MLSIASSKKIGHLETPSLISTFFNWTKKQDEHRLTWLAIALSVHGCFTTPFTAMTIMATTQNFALFMVAIGAMAATLVTNLASMPTRITIPVFFLSLIVELAIVAASLATLI